MLDSDGCLTLNVTEDSIVEEDEQLLLQISSADSAVIQPFSSALVTITDDDCKCSVILSPHL